MVAVAIALQHVCLIQALIEPKSECQDGITSDALFAAGSFHTCAVRVNHSCAALAVGADLHTERARPQTRRVLAPARRTSARRGACARRSADVVCVVSPSRRRMCTTANGLHWQPCTIGCAELYASDPVMCAAKQGVQKWSWARRTLPSDGCPCAPGDGHDDQRRAGRRRLQAEDFLLGMV